jgi:hypothetical protein
MAKVVLLLSSQSYPSMLATVSEFPLWVTVSNSDLKLFSHGYAPINLLTISLEGGKIILLPLSEFCCCVLLSLYLQMSITLTDPGSSSMLKIVMLSFCGKTHQMGLLLQEGTRDDSSSRANCTLWLQDHQVTVQMQMLWSPRVHALVLLGGKCRWKKQCAHFAIGRGVLLILIPYELLKYLDLWWVTAAILTDIWSIFSIWSSLRMDVTPIQLWATSFGLLLMHKQAYELRCGETVVERNCRSCPGDFF